MSYTEIVMLLPLFQNTIILRRPRQAVFGDIVKIVTMFIKIIFKDSKKSLNDWKLCIKVESMSAFLDIAKFADFQSKNAGVSRTTVWRKVTQKESLKRPGEGEHIIKHVAEVSKQ